MRKINKNICISTDYKKWIDDLIKEAKSIPAYTSSGSAKYYKDVLVALLHCQNGLCAYTEIRLLEEEKVNLLANFIDKTGKYIGERPQCPADVEHFDSSLKMVNGWDWENLFAVFGYVNQTIKRVEEKKRGIFPILKPDSAEYDPFQLLKYDADEHIFYANFENYKEEVCSQIEDMILILGINCDFIKMQRKKYLSEIIERTKINSTLIPHQFITAYEMLKRQLLLP